MDIAQLDRALAALRGAVAALPAPGDMGTMVAVDSATLATIRAAFAELDDGGRRNIRPTEWGGHRAAIADAMRGGQLGRQAADRRALDRQSDGRALARRVPGSSGR